MHDTAPSSTAIRRSSNTTLAGIATALGLYLAAVVIGAPQHGRDLLVAAQAAHQEHGDDADHGRAGHAAVAVDHGDDPEHADAPAADNAAKGGHHADAHAEPHADDGHAAHHEAGPPPPAWAVIPFVLLLGAIAALPLIPALAHWWEYNSSKLLVAGSLGLVTLVYYLLLHGEAIEQHFPAHGVVDPAPSGLSWGIAGTVLANALLAEYVPFITLLFALYCVTGGVRIEGDMQATPTTNTILLALGAAMASFIGTTGAAMLLVRPLLETNHERKRVVHTLVFFIFLVCNCGGCLLPIGDPPLFLGYLQGVPFLWTFSLWKEWLTVNLSLLAIYWVWDSFFAYPRERLADREIDRVTARSLQVSGLTLNLPLMAGVILAVALLDPSKPLPGTDWHPWIFLREAVLLGLVGCSLWFGSTDIRVKNGFSYFAILEVAALFVGIFVCMQPALALLNEHGASLGIRSPGQFFWTTGLLSSVLDNAPTYLVFFKTAQSLPVDGDLVAGVEAGRLAGISLGAVFLGAMTYIGNGPNFMVKAIAEGAGVRMPSFFGYLLYSGGVLLPVFALTAWLFL
ncbi:MAG: sodium:proton antiporter [Planctomycetia bacterium]|jgi:Na+/H+ antiporter NhaD/arsenite permease-like protein|nr:sodium:proton antiporter [Planctomycetia bacterium]NDH94336.1 sodium:proton antiporter [Planctomycetia bacterium]